MKRASARVVLDNPQPDKYYYVLVTRYTPMENRKRGIPVLKENGGVYDVWDRDLAPSRSLLKWWKEAPPTRERWMEYEKRFRQDVPSNVVLRRLATYEKAAGTKEVVLVCEEEDSAYPYCHTWILLDIYKAPVEIRVPERPPPIIRIGEKPPWEVTPPKKPPKPPPKKQWRVITTCPIHKKGVHVVVDAKDSIEARRKALGMNIPCPWGPINEVDHTFKIEKIETVVPYPWKPRDIITRPVEAPRPPTEREAPTILLSAKRIENTVTVTIGRGRDYLSITFPRVEAETYDKLMQVAEAAGKATIRNAILAFLLAHSGGTKTMVTGFLNASGFPDATVSTVGEALSRLRRERIIYRYPATFIFTYYPLGLYGKKEKVITSEIMGEPVYGISHATRLKILERLKFEPYLAWWRTEMLKPPPILPTIKKPVEYEWVRIIKSAPSFRAAEDFKRYGPYKKGVTTKLPLTMAYFLVRTDYAEWLNPEKENVLEAEKMFRYQPIERVKRQATLIEY